MNKYNKYKTMKTIRISNLLGILLMSLSFLFTTSCNKDDIEPDDAVTLNMLDELNGKTLLGQSDVYINKANNFRTSSNLITEAGSASGIGSIAGPKLGNLVREAAVTPGHIYQIFDRESINEFPSGTLAVQVGATYYQVYAVSAITTNDVTTGAVVKYISVSPDGEGLPGLGHQLEKFRNVGEEIEMKLPKGAECYWNEDTDNVFDISTDGGKLLISLKYWPSNSNSYSIYIRLGSVFSSVLVDVVR